MQRVWEGVEVWCSVCQEGRTVVPRMVANDSCLYCGQVVAECDCCDVCFECGTEFDKK
jgi:hypothetical protein